MKLKYLYIAIALVGASFSSCDDDDDNGPTPDNIPAAVISQFNKQFPDAQNVKWQQEGVYYTAEYSKNNSQVDVEAWYKPDGTWMMTNNDYGKDLFMIPAAVNASFEKTEYAKSPWAVDDIDQYSYPDAASDFYIIEVEQTGQTDMQLYFKPDGTLLKTIPDSGTPITPDTVI